MNQDRAEADPDRLLVAQLTGEARHRAKWRPLTEKEKAAALAELRALAGGRPTCWPRWSAFSRAKRRRTGRAVGPVRRAAVLDGRGPTRTPYRAGFEEGCRSANARRRPFSGGVHTLRCKLIERSPQVVTDRLVFVDHQLHGSAEFAYRTTATLRRMPRPQGRPAGWRPCADSGP